MTSRSVALAAALMLTPITSAFASGTEPPSMPSSPPSTPDARPQEVLTPRQQAERLYGDAYDEIERAKKDLAADKAKNAEKRFRRAADRVAEATQLDSTYHEAWNLLGFASRKLGDYPKSLAAYRTSVRLKPDFAPAREYFGAALLESGDVAGAEEQLKWLRRLGADALAAELDQAIAPKRASAEAKPDSTH